jgi:tight adherence protein B
MTDLATALAPLAVLAPAGPGSFTGPVVLAVGCGLLAGAGVLVVPPRVRLHRGVASPAPGRSRLGPVAHWAQARRVVASRCRSLARRRRRPVPMPTSTVLALVDDLATQVRAGAAPTRAWSVAMGMVTETVHGDWATTSGGEVTASSASATWLLAGPGETPRACLNRLADAPGAPPALLALSAAWALCEDVGAPLAEVLQAVADGLRQDAEVEADIESALAAPRSTARLLALLPMAGLALGQLVGARPVHVLLHSSVGRLCAVTGLGLAVAGRWWARRLVERTAAQL